MIYFDNAATTLKKPDSVARAVSEAMSSFGNPERGTHASSLNATRIIYATRKRLAELFNAQSPACIAFTNNATTALNTAISGLLEPNDKVVTTAMEHNSVLRPLYRLGGVKNDVRITFVNGIWENTNIRLKNDIYLKIVETDKMGVLNYDALSQAITTNTKAVLVTHASNVSGNINDIKKISEIAHANGAKLIVDAAQTAGVIDIDVQDAGIDVLCFSGHKNLYGPQGTGGIYVSPDVELKPLVIGGSGIQTYDKEHPKSMPTALEAGTLNSHGIAGLNASLEFLDKTGLNNIFEHENKLLKAFYEGVSRISNIKIYGDFSTLNRCAICSINIAELDSSQISDILATKYNIATRPGGHCAPLTHQCMGTENTGVVRFSFSYFNNLDEIHKCLNILESIAKKCS